MSTAGQFNTKSPTIKRILREAAELSHATSADYAAAPLETNLFEWHFTIKGPPATPYADGLYHGRIVLPPTYPLRPPSFRFSTPSGRFEPNREICLSISGHHEESWQPAWGIRTALVAIRAFMESDAKGQVGGVDSTKQVRLRLAAESRAWRCPLCNKANDDIMRAREADVAADNAANPKPADDTPLPAALNLSYRDELRSPATPTSPPAAAAPPPATPAVTGAFSPTSPTPTTRRRQQQQQHQRPARADATGWLDMLIGGLTLALAYMIIRKLAEWL